jgi:alpha-D-ribose 1-methylphosphonate 5-triphosphate synthase subunit PhnI
MTPECIFYKMARDQRRTELERGEGFTGTLGYELQGCYSDCDGKDKSRQCYTQLNIKKEGQNGRTKNRI